MWSSIGFVPKGEGLGRGEDKETLDTTADRARKLMSDHGPGTSCTKAEPSAAEAARIGLNYANGATAMRPQQQTVIDAWPARPSPHHGSRPPHLRLLSRFASGFT